MNSEKSQIEPEDLIKALESVDEMREQISAKESDALRRIYLRFCLLRGLAIDFDQIRRRKNFPGNPNYWSYYYRYGTPDEYLLMTRELVVTVDDNKPELNITFNKELLDE